MKTRLPLTVLFAAAALALLWGGWLWFCCRIEVPAGQMAIVTAKTGTPLPPGEILAEPGQQGIRRLPLAEGRHFLNPVTHDWKLVPVQQVPVGRIGVVTSKTGRELPPGEIIAADDRSKGVRRRVLGPGTYRLNPEGYTLTLHDALNIPVGYVGIVTSQTGRAAAPGAFAGIGEKGVMEQVLQPGLYYVNPKVYQVDVVEIGMSQVSIIGRAGTVVLTKNSVSNASDALDGLREAALRQQQIRRDAYVSNNDSLLDRRDARISIGAAPDTLRKRLSGTPGASEAAKNRLAGRRSPAVKRHASADRAGNRMYAAEAAAEEDFALAANDALPRPVPAAARADSSDAVAFGMNRFVQFPSIDGFQILLDMTVEFELLPENISRIYMLYGDLPAVVDKILLPQILSISRMKGSYYKARDFIDGEGRLKFQNEMTSELVKTLAERHILVHNAIIRHVEVPREILAPIQAAGEAKEQDLTNRERQNTARKQAELNIRLAKVDQLRREVEQETDKKVATIAAETKQTVARLDAETKLAVAKLDLERARIEADTTRCLGEARVRSDFLISNEEALGTRRRAEVFRNASTLADLTLVESLNPDLSIRLLHAGEGTLWTDLKNAGLTLPVPRKTAK